MIIRPTQLRILEIGLLSIHSESGVEQSNEANDVSLLTLQGEDTITNQVRNALLGAGVPLELVLDAVQHRIDPLEPFPEGVREEAPVNQQDLQPPLTVPTVDPKRSLVWRSLVEPQACDSVFDSKLRVWFEQHSVEFFADAQVTPREIQGPWHNHPTSKHHSSTTTAATNVEPVSEQRELEIVLYTFGSFYTSCLYMERWQVRCECLVLAEQNAKTLQQVIGLELAWEGLVSLLVITIANEMDHRRLTQWLHLLRTLLAIPASSNNTLESSVSTPGNPSQVTVGCNLHDLLVRDGVERIVTKLLMNPHWQSDSNTATELVMSCRFVLQQHKSMGYPFLSCLVSRVFLRSLAIDPGAFVGVNNQMHLLASLIDDVTALFVGSIKQETRDDEQTNSLFDAVEQFLSEVPLCVTKKKSSGNSFTSDQMQNAVRLARQTLHKWQTAFSLVQGQMSVDATRSLVNHEPLFHELSVESDQEQAKVLAQMRKYFETFKRPDALYRYTFLQPASEANGQPRTRFSKGNINFQGEISTREPLVDNKHFHHPAVHHRGKGFVFDQETPDASWQEHQQISTPFAQFQGFLSHRNRVVPEQSRDKAAPPVGATSTASKQQQNPLHKSQASKVEVANPSSTNRASNNEPQVPNTATVPSRNDKKLPPPTASTTPEPLFSPRPKPSEPPPPAPPAPQAKPSGQQALPKVANASQDKTETRQAATATKSTKESAGQSPNKVKCVEAFVVASSDPSYEDLTD